MSSVQKIITDQWRPLVEKAIWAALPFAGSQLVRLASSIGLAWLLAPELIGAMVLINTLRTGVELLTDVGIGQSIVRDPKGLDPDFYNTAWTIQIIRGFLLFALMLALTYPIAMVYDRSELLILLPAIAPIFLITGLSSPARFLLQKQMEIKTLALFDFGVSIFVALAHIVIAFYMPNIWSLILGLLIGSTGASIASYFILDCSELRLRLDNSSLKSIFEFGKWIFLSSIVFYFGTSFDRLYFAQQFSAATLGIYGIAKTYAETFTSLIARVSQMIIFPKISSTPLTGAELRDKIASIRFGLIAVISILLAAIISVADEFIFYSYDLRYRGAGIIVTIFMAGAWFAVLHAVADATMLGLGKSAEIALANGVRLLSVAVVLPLAFIEFGISGALFALIFSDIVRYMSLCFSLFKIKMSFILHDVLLLSIFVLFILLFRQGTLVVGLTGGMGGWLGQLEVLNV